MGKFGGAGRVAMGIAAGCLSMTIQAQSAWDYGPRGLEWSDKEDGSYLWLGLRGQFRASNIEEDLRTLEDFTRPDESGIWVNRARYKIGARWKKDVALYHEYDLRNSQLLDLRATWVSNPDLHLRLGQWKSEYNRARIDSSGKQQFTERSIVTYWFTIDRQWGVSTSGRLWRDTGADTSWWAGVLAGNGRNESSDGGRPMLFTRWQWNYTGNVLPFSQSAVKRYEHPHGSLSFGAVANDSRHTRYSSSGGGDLPGYEEGEDNQYRIYQAMQEWALHHGGWSFQQELHWKRIRDRVNGGTQNLVGGYAQVGLFPSHYWPDIPDKLEIALRGAVVHPDSLQDRNDLEITIAGNWFFNGHRNKLTLEGSYLEIEEDGVEESEYRFRLQWEVSI